MASNPEPTKEYAFRVIATDNVQAYMNEQALQGYVLMNVQPFARKIKDTSDGTAEEVITFAVTMERPRKQVPESSLGTSSISIETPAMVPIMQPSN